VTAEPAAAAAAAAADDTRFRNILIKTTYFPAVEKSSFAYIFINALENALNFDINSSSSSLDLFDRNFTSSEDELMVADSPFEELLDYEDNSENPLVVDESYVNDAENVVTKNAYNKIFESNSTKMASKMSDMPRNDQSYVPMLIYSLLCSAFIIVLLLSVIFLLLICQNKGIEKHIALPKEI
jgi:hypothetical protein